MINVIEKFIVGFIAVWIVLLVISIYQLIGVIGDVNEEIDACVAEEIKIIKTPTLLQKVNVDNLCSELVWGW